MDTTIEVGSSSASDELQNNTYSVHKQDESVNASTTTFVDYIQPPSPKSRPPSKYKLWLIVLVLVYFAEWFAKEAMFTEVCSRESLGGIMFCCYN